MAKTQEYISEMGYDFEDLLGSEMSVIEEFSSYTGSQYVCDVISEIADSYIPIYNNDVWDGASEIRDYIEQAISEGLADTTNADLIKIFQAGYYCYFTEILYNNLDAIAFNTIVEKVNEYIGGTDEKLDIDAIEERINQELQLFDNNSYISDLEEIYNGVVEDIENGEFNE